MFTKPGDLVIDALAGSGSLSQAAMLEGRSSFAFEAVPSLSTRIAETLNSTLPRVMKGECNYALDNSYRHYQTSWAFNQENCVVLETPRVPKKKAATEADTIGMFTLTLFLSCPLIWNC